MSVARPMDALPESGKDRTISQTLAEFAARLNIDQVPAPVIERARLPSPA